jgi:hypothetical protein
MNVALDRLVMQNRRILFDEVRTEGKTCWGACCVDGQCWD